MMTNFELFFIIKNIQIQKQNHQHPLKGFNTCAFMKYILEPIINLKAFDEGLSNKTHVHIFLVQYYIYINPNLPMTLNFIYHFP